MRICWRICYPSLHPALVLFFSSSLLRSSLPLLSLLSLPLSFSPPLPFLYVSPQFPCSFPFSPSSLFKPKNSYKYSEGKRKVRSVNRILMLHTWEAGTVYSEVMVIPPKNTISMFHLGLLFHKFTIHAGSVNTSET